MVITNKWWPIGLFIASIVLYAIGGGLVGSCAAYDIYGDLYVNYGMWAGGVALLSLASVCFVAGVTLLVLFLLHRNRTLNASRQMENGNGHGLVTYAQAEQQQKPEVSVSSVPVSAPAGSPPVGAATTGVPVPGQKFCTACGTPVQSKFCPGCGAPTQQ